MGPKKPRRSNLNDVWQEYTVVSQLNDDTTERHESHNVCLETCFTTFPEPQFTTTTVVTAEPLDLKKILYRPEINKSLPVLDRNKNIDIINKRHYSSRDLCDVAPLAQPEHFSDASSSCSSTSNLENAPCSSLTKYADNIPSSSTPRAPQMMRRTPKIIGSLSTCTDDVRNIKSFEKLVKSGNTPLNNSSNSSSNLSYASGISNKTNCSNDYEHFVSIGQCSWQREQTATKQCEIESVSDVSKNSTLAEELLEEILEYAECADFFRSEPSFLDGYDDRLFDNEFETNYDKDINFKIPTIKLTKSTTPAMNSPLILSPSSLEIDPDVISNYAIDLNLEQEHRSLLSHQNLQTSILKVSHTGTCNGSHTPPCAKTVTFSPDVLSIDDNLLHGSCEQLPAKQERLKFWNFIPFRYFTKARATSSMPNITKIENVSTIYSNTERKKSMDQIFTKNEALPLLNATKSDSSEYSCSNVFSKGKVCVDSEV